MTQSRVATAQLLRGVHKGKWVQSRVVVPTGVEHQGSEGSKVIIPFAISASLR